MPVEDTLPKEGAYWTNLLAMMEVLRTGTTCFVDMHMFHEQSCRAASEAGVRGYIGAALMMLSLVLMEIDPRAIFRKKP
jgi:5-methylthioadenosine/S-adenosylhomocysteine deaminase